MRLAGIIDYTLILESIGEKIFQCDKLVFNNSIAS